jgi:hypothetical protein
MKKVRYAIGAVGVAPILCLAAVPTVNADAATGRVPARSTKTVSLRHSRSHAAPEVICGQNFSKKLRRTTAPFFTEKVFYSPTAGGGDCISTALGSIQKDQTKLEMRTRVYIQPGGTREFSNYVHGIINPNVSTHWTAGVGYDDATHKPQVCIAVVSQSFHSIVDYGPICINF